LNKNKKITLSAAAITVVLIALASTYYIIQSPTKGSSLLPSGQPPQAQITVTGDILTQKMLTVRDVSQMPLTNVTSTIKGETANYVGVTLLTLLNKAGASWDTGAITIIGSDNYNKTINFYQAYNSTQYPGSEVIVAIAKNGKWITDASEGPFKLITPSFASSYNIKSVQKINLQPWTVTINGTNLPITLTSSNLTHFEMKTVTAAFAPGGEPQRTSNWTGVSLSSILQAGGIPTSASKVTVTAVDGYSRDYTITQVQSLGILIGIQENGQYLTPVNGQPYRLIIPSEDFKWGQYWVRWVTQVTVS
jgi:DMSO/TMAO reductase YedYZ molybdopterin-dependent catalytic subunit